MKFALVVDDSESQRKYISDILMKTKQFHKIIEAKDSDVAMKMCMKFDPDMIFMDYDMPRTDGLTASETIIKMKKDAHIVMVTAINRDNLRKKALEIGIKDVITKPYTQTQIVMSVLSLTSNQSQKEISVKN